ncbi:MAG: hypothetical protein QF926_08930 [Alphaproteobacteria bacterium]|jgi:predicted Zn-dependent protease|nr:hypothetical protein [Alphaproteobacteria bacterium]MDP6516729.1 hypothetical protein [Alphaproteobacteria bacterium]
MNESEQAVVSALRRALEQHRAGRPAASEGLYRQLAAAPPGAPEALHPLGRVALKIGRQAEAADYLCRAVTSDPE